MSDEDWITLHNQQTIAASVMLGVSFFFIVSKTKISEINALNSGRIDRDDDKLERSLSLIQSASAAIAFWWDFFLVVI